MVKATLILKWSKNLDGDKESKTYSKTIDSADVMNLKESMQEKYDEYIKKIGSDLGNSFTGQGSLTGEFP